MQEMQKVRVQSLCQEDPLEKEMATHSSILGWKIPWTEEPSRLQSMVSQGVGHDWVTFILFFLVASHCPFLIMPVYLTSFEPLLRDFSCLSFPLRLLWEPPCRTPPRAEDWKVSTCLPFDEFWCYIHSPKSFPFKKLCWGQSRGQIPPGNMFSIPASFVAHQSSEDLEKVCSEEPSLNFS